LSLYAHLKVVDPLSTTRRTAELHAAQGPVSGNRKPLSHQHTNSRARSWRRARCAQGQTGNGTCVIWTCGTPKPPPVSSPAIF